jgi:hypothetical protein
VAFLKDFWVKHWEKIITIILSCACGAVLSFYVTILAVHDKIERAKDSYDGQVIRITDNFNGKISKLKENYDKKIEAVRSECKEDNIATSTDLIKMGREVSVVNECVFGHLKHSTEKIAPLRTKLEILRNDFDHLREKYTRDWQIAESLESIHSIIHSFMQKYDFNQPELISSNTENATVDDS